MEASRRTEGQGNATVSREACRNKSRGDDWVSFDYVFSQNSVQGSAPPTKHQEPVHVGIPVHIRPFAEHDDISDVSNVSNSTPFSVATNHNSPCEVLPSVQGPHPFSETGLASTAAIFMNQVVSDVLDNVTSSIDPNVLLEFQGRTRSLVRRSLSMVREINIRHAETSFSTGDVENGEHIFLEPPAVEMNRPLLATSECRDDKARRLPLWSLMMPSNSPNRQCSIQDKDSPSERCGVEVSSEGSIIDFGQLGEEIEISRYHASVVLDSRDMNTEIPFYEDQVTEDVSNRVETQIVKQPVIKQQLDHRRKLAVPRLFRMRSQDQPSSTKDSGDSEVHREVPKSLPRGSAKTVSTMHSDESTTAMQSMHTDGSGWIQDPSIVRILQC